jgi:sirohydrochlorin ferrochelatase
MSTTRLPSRREQATEVGGPAPFALILAAHGERKVADPNRALIEHRDALAARLDGLVVACGVVNGEPSLVAALEIVARSGAQELLIYPFFMSDGYFVSKVVPERVAASGLGLTPAMLPPLGLDPGLPGLMMSDALKAADVAGFPAREARLVVVGHGSKQGSASADATRRVVGELQSTGRFASVAPGFLEEPPFVGNVLAAEKMPTVVSGFFAGNGMHSSHDVPAAIDETGANAIYGGPVGTSPAVRDLIVEAVDNRISIIS